MFHPPQQKGRLGYFQDSAAGSVDSLSRKGWGLSGSRVAGKLVNIQENILQAKKSLAKPGISRLLLAKFTHGKGIHGR